MARRSTRRAFIAGGVAAAGLAGGAALRGGDDEQAGASQHPKPSADKAASLPERVLGRTNRSVSVFGLGGAGQTPLSQPGKEKESAQIIERAYQLGIRYFDTAANYGPSEENYGRVLPAVRRDIFLASKTDRRTRDDALRELERSLTRLKTDHLDLWQMHHVSFKEELDRMFGKGGAVEAIEEAKRQKLIRFAGISGHHEPEIIAEGLRRYDFDATLVSLNAADRHHPRPFIDTVLPVARRKNVGVIAMKIPAYGRLLRPGVLDMDEAIGYVLSLEGVHACVVATEDVAMLERNVAAARRARQMNAVELAQIERRTANVWQDVSFYRAWT